MRSDSARKAGPSRGKAVLTMAQYQIALYRTAACEHSGLNERIEGYVWHAGRVQEVEDLTRIQPIRAGTRTTVEREISYYVGTYGEATFIDGSKIVPNSKPWPDKNFLGISEKLK